MKTILRTCTLVLAVAVGLPAAGPARATTENGCRVDWPAETPRPERAISLARLEEELRACGGGPGCSRELWELYGLTRIEGVVIDRANRDIVLWGRTEPGMPVLHLEDFVAALRNVEYRYLVRRDGVLYYSDPGVSIDPIPEVMRQMRAAAEALGRAGLDGVDEALDRWCETCALPQRVRVMGVPRHSRFARVMLDADYLMKRLADGSAGIEGLPGVGERILAADLAALRRGEQPAGTGLRMNRFWFYPGDADYRADGRGIFLERVEVVLLDEAQLLAADGRLAGTGTSDPFARAFACDVSKRYRELAARPGLGVYRELENLFRWLALARLMAERGAFAEAGYEPGYLLDGLELARVDVPDTVPGVARVLRHDVRTRNGRLVQEVMFRFPSCGGVAIELADRLRRHPDVTGELRRVSIRVLASRPSLFVVSWKVTG